MLKDEDFWDLVGTDVEPEIMLPAQKKAWLKHLDGTYEYHDIDLQHNGLPHMVVNIRYYPKAGAGLKEVEEKKFLFAYKEMKGDDEYLVYKES